MSEMVVDVSLVSDEDVGDGSNLVGETILSNKKSFMAFRAEILEKVQKRSRRAWKMCTITRIDRKSVV